MNHYVIHLSDLQRKEAYTVREHQPHDWFQIRKLTRKQSIWHEQSIFEFALLNHAAGFASIFKMKHKVLAAEENLELKAFFVFGIPSHEKEKTDSRVIEWGGDAAAVPGLHREAFTYGLDSLVFDILAFQTAPNHQLGSLEKEEKLYPGTMKIMNVDLLLAQLGPYLEGKIEISRIGENHKKLTSKKDSIILSNDLLEELILKGNKKGDSPFNDVFPIPFPYPQGMNFV